MRQTHGNKPSMRETHPHLADEFHPTKNGNLTPDNITAGSHQRVWWLCPTCDHEWPTTRCSNRISKGLTGCPYCNNSVLHSDGRNSMANTHPHLAKEYQGDATKIMLGGRKKLLWKCSTCDNEYLQSGRHRANGHGCPACTGRFLHSDGRNSMAVTHPHLALEYQGDATKIMAGTHHKIDWKCSTCDHKWEASGHNRVQANAGCPACSNKAIHIDGRNSMAKTHPHLAAEFHPTKNGNLTPDNLMAGSDEKVWWLCLTCEHEWETHTGSRISKGGTGCPSCAEQGFRPDKAGHVYLMKYEGVNEKPIYKIGISCQPEKRKQQLLLHVRGTHSEVNIDIIDTMYFDVGKDAMEMEKTFHAMEEHRFTPKKKFGGWTEMFKASIVDVWNGMVKA